MNKEKQRRVLKLFAMGKYSCDQFGNVYGPRGNKLRVTTSGTRKYPRVTFVDSLGNRICLLVHQAVVLFFLGEFDPTLVIDHLNRDIQDCGVANLELVTVKENNRRARETFTVPRDVKTGRFLKCGR